MSRPIPLYTVEGVPDADVSTHPFTTDDGLGLSLLRFHRAPCDDVVVLLHGLTTSSDMFIMPEHYNLTRYLLDHGFTDVWCLDYRMSNRHPYNLQAHRFTMDDVALYDHPAALAAIRARVGNARIHVVAHCLGSTSFLMSLFGKAVDNVASVVANSVGLTPRVPGWSRLKITLFPFLVEHVLGFQYVTPRWADEPGLSRGKIMSRMTSLFHRECDHPACHMVSLMWGSGHPAVYEHHNMSDITHRRVQDLFGGTSLHYYRHVRKMLAAGNTAVKYDPRNPKHDRLPDNYLEHAGDIDTPVFLTTGDNNNVFRDSNIECHRRLEAAAPGRHRLHVFPRYGHQDVYMGKDAAEDIFPTLLDFLRTHSDARAVASPATTTLASP
jgi:lysosomal acid lipase/cholesteryl ester hydrolase